MPTASHPVCQVVGPTKPTMQPKRVAARGWGGSCLTTHPHVCKVTHVISPSPEATISAPPVAGPSWMAQPPLFKEPALSGGDKVRPGGPVSSGMCHNRLFRCAPTDSHPAFGTLGLLKWKADKMVADATPLPPPPPLPLPVPKQPHCNCELIDQMHGLL